MKAEAWEQQQQVEQVTTVTPNPIQPATQGQAAGFKNSITINEANGTIPGPLNIDMTTLLQIKNACNDKDIDKHTNPTHPYYNDKVNKHYQYSHHNLNCSITTTILDVEIGAHFLPTPAVE